MRLVLQRVTQASVAVDGAAISSIGPGLLCLAGLTRADVEVTVIILQRSLKEADFLLSLFSMIERP